MVKPFSCYREGHRADEPSRMVQDVQGATVPNFASLGLSFFFNSCSPSRLNNSMAVIAHLREDDAKMLQVPVYSFTSFPLPSVSYIHASCTWHDSFIYWSQAKSIQHLQLFIRFSLHVAYHVLRRPSGTWSCIVEAAEDAMAIYRRQNSLLGQPWPKSGSFSGLFVPPAVAEGQMSWEF